VARTAAWMSAPLTELGAGAEVLEPWATAGGVPVVGGGAALIGANDDVGCSPLKGLASAVAPGAAARPTRISSATRAAAATACGSCRRKRQAIAATTTTTAKASHATSRSGTADGGTVARRQRTHSPSGAVASPCSAHFMISEGYHRTPTW